jgi:hypothetical protein
MTATGKAEFAPPGYLLFLRDGTLLAQWLDLGSLELRGKPVPVAAEVSGPTGFSVSENGVLAYRRGHEEVGRRLFWYSRDGVRTPAGGDLGYSAVRLSPDQNRVVLRRGDPNTSALRCGCWSWQGAFFRA